MPSTIGETAKSCQGRSCPAFYPSSIPKASEACERSAGYGTIRTPTSISSAYGEMATETQQGYGCKSVGSTQWKGSTTVALQCEICQKKPVSGNNVSHANNKTRRVFNPNIQTVRAMIGKTHRRIRVCTRCLRSGLVRKAV